jgi:hypothetical protein
MSIRIAIIVEGATEKAFMPKLREFLKERLQDKMPKLDPVPWDGRIPKSDELQRVVRKLLTGKNAADAVIALSDVYTGSQDFSDAEDAKRKMRQWVGEEPHFHPHTAQYEFEAWLLPFWDTIQRITGSRRKVPGVHPEQINHNKPPSYHLKEAFHTGSTGKSYVKVRDATRILKKNDLARAVEACPELKRFLNTILILCGAESI